MVLDPAPNKKAAPTLDDVAQCVDKEFSKLDVIQDPSVPACQRSGQCCQFVLLGTSPRRLLRDYEDWNQQPRLYHDDTKGIHYDDIHLIYPMLAGRCLGRWVNPFDESVHWVYGPCKNLGVETQENGTELHSCTIHDIRPRLCRGYPYYGKSVELQMGAAKGKEENPGYMRGCGFNENPEAGFSKADILNHLQPIPEDERDYRCPSTPMTSTNPATTAPSETTSLDTSAKKE